METEMDVGKSNGAGQELVHQDAERSQAAEFCSPGIMKLAAALAKAQGAFLPIERTREVTVRPKETPAYTFRYAPLDVVLAATLPALNANGLSMVSLPISGGDKLRTLLLHESGEWMAVEVRLPEYQGPQKFGSALTYMRRYSIISLLGVASEEDDDGNAAEGNGVERKSDRPPRQSPSPAPQPARERPWMKRLQLVVGKLKLGEGEANERGLKGKARDDFERDVRVSYLRWCAGRDNIKSTLDLTDAEADLVIRRAELGEVPQ